MFSLSLSLDVPSRFPREDINQNKQKQHIGTYITRPYGLVVVLPEPTWDIKGSSIAEFV